MLIEVEQRSSEILLLCSVKFVLSDVEPAHEINAKQVLWGNKSYIWILGCNFTKKSWMHVARKQLLYMSSALIHTVADWVLIISKVHGKQDYVIEHSEQVTTKHLKQKFLSH